MLEIHTMTQGHRLWERTISLAESCSWKAGPFLARRMRENGFLGWERVFAACADGRVVGYCTFTKTDELPESYGLSPFIGFVFVEEAYRGKRISGEMIRAAVSYAAELGYETLYIMSGEKGLYEKYGFEKLGNYETVYGSVDQLFSKAVK